MNNNLVCNHTKFDEHHNLVTEIIIKKGKYRSNFQQNTPSYVYLSNLKPQKNQQIIRQQDGSPGKESQRHRLRPNLVCLFICKLHDLNKETNIAVLFSTCSQTKLKL